MTKTKTRQVTKKNQRLAARSSSETRRALACMKEDLQCVNQKMLEWTHKLDRNNITGWIEIGRMIEKVAADENKYGEFPVEKLAAALALAPAELYRFRSVANMFGGDQAALDQLLSRQISNGHPVTFSHLVELASVDNAKLREKLIEKAFKQCLTVRDVQNEVKEIAKRRRPR